MAKPILFLDVDGVLNILPRDKAYEWPDIRQLMMPSETNGGEWPFHVSDLMGECLRSLHQSHIEIRWLTTWADDANTNVAPEIGMPNDLIVTAHPPFRVSGPWKFSGLKATVEAEKRPFIWIDDDEITLKQYEWASSCGVPNMLLPVHHSFGISPADIRHIQRFAAEMKLWKPENSKND